MLGGFGGHHQEAGMQELGLLQAPLTAEALN